MINSDEGLPELPPHGDDVPDGDPLVPPLLDSLRPDQSFLPDRLRFDAPTLGGETMAGEVDRQRPAAATATSSGGGDDASSFMPAPPMPVWTIDGLDSNLGRPAKPLSTNPAYENLGPRYTLHRLVGEGGMGEVWEATQESLGRRLAVKRIRSSRLAEATDDEDYARRLEQEFHIEAVANAALDHPNIVPVHDLGMGADGSPMLAMKLVRGRPWDETIDADFAQLPVEEFLAKHLPVLVDVAQAVAFAHAQGIVHRDIKPSQVMVGAFGETLLTDWGLAMRCEPVGNGRTAASQAASKAPSRPDVAAELGASAEASGSDSILVASDSVTPDTIPPPTRASNPAGTPAFMAPEQTTPSALGIGPWTDVFLLGGTLYYLLTGQHPHGETEARDALRAAARCEIVPPSVRASGRLVPADLGDLAMRAMARRPSSRISSASAFLEALQDHLSGAVARREAAEQLQLAEAELESATTYGDYRGIVQRLDKVRGAWPGAPRLAERIDAAQLGYARRALEQGDLALATLEADRIRNTALRAPLTTDIAAAERRLASHRFQRRAGIATALILAASIAGVSAWFSLRMEEKNRLLDVQNSELDLTNRQLERRTDVALRQSREVRDVLSLMLKEMAANLDQTDEQERELSRHIAERVMTYVEGIDLSGMPKEFKTGTASALHDYALYLNQLGRPQEAAVCAQLSLDIKTVELGRDHEWSLMAMRQLSNALANIEDFDRAVPLLEEWRELSRKAGKSGMEGAALGKLTHIEMRRGNFERVEELVEEHEQLAKRAGITDPQFQMMALNRLSEVYRNNGQIEKGAMYADKLVAMEREVSGGNYEDLVGALGQAGILATSEGKLEKSRALFEEAIEIAEVELPDTHPHFPPMYNAIARLYLMQDETERAVEMFLKARDSGRRVYGDAPSLIAAVVPLNLGMALMRLGRYDEARPYIEEADREFVRVNTNHPYRGMVDLGRGMADWFEGHPELAKQHADDASARFEAGGLKFPMGHVVQTEMLKLRIALEEDADDVALIEGHVEQARSMLQEVDEGPDSTTEEEPSLRETYGLALLAAGRSEEALEQLRTAYEEAVALRNGETSMSELAQASLGLAFAAAGDDEAAREHLSASLPIVQMRYRKLNPYRQRIEAAARQLGVRVPETAE